MEARSREGVLCWSLVDGRGAVHMEGAGFACLLETVRDLTASNARFSVGHDRFHRHFHSWTTYAVGIRNPPDAGSSPARPSHNLCKNQCFDSFVGGVGQRGSTTARPDVRETAQEVLCAFGLHALPS